MLRALTASMAGMFASDRRGDCSDRAAQLAAHAIVPLRRFGHRRASRSAAEVNGRVRFGHPSGCLGVGLRRQPRWPMIVRGADEPIGGR